MALEPSRAVLIPWRDPERSFRASKFTDVYTMTTSAQRFDITYVIGTPYTATYGIAIKNNAIQHSIELVPSIPSYLQTNMPSKIVIAPQQTVQYTCSVNNGGIKNLIIARKLQVQDVIFFTGKVLGVNGPVYVSTQNERPTVPPTERPPTESHTHWSFVPDNIVIKIRVKNISEETEWPR